MAHAGQHLEEERHVSHEVNGMLAGSHEGLFPQVLQGAGVHQRLLCRVLFEVQRDAAHVLAAKHVSGDRAGSGAGV